MADTRSVTARLVLALIQGRFGCLDAAAATINARWGRGACKGTMSKKARGEFDWTLADVIALEDASGAFPVTQYLAGRMAPGAISGAASLSDHAGCISREAGEAVCAVLRAAQSAGANDAAGAIKELIDVQEAVAGAIARLQGQQLKGRVA